MTRKTKTHSILINLHLLLLRQTPPLLLFLFLLLLHRLLVPLHSRTTSPQFRLLRFRNTVDNILQALLLVIHLRLRWWFWRRLSGSLPRRIAHFVVVVRIPLCIERCEPSMRYRSDKRPSWCSECGKCSGCAGCGGREVGACR